MRGPSQSVSAISRVKISAKPRTRWERELAYPANYDDEKIAEYQAWSQTAGVHEFESTDGKNIGESLEVSFSTSIYCSLLFST